MSAPRFFLAFAALALCGSGVGCSRPGPVPVRDAPTDKIMVVQESARKNGAKWGDDIVSVTVRDGPHWRTERFFVRGQALVFVYNGRPPAGNAGGNPSRKSPPQGEFSTESTLRTVHEFVTASRSRWFAYRGTVRQVSEFAREGANARDDRTFDFYEGLPPGGDSPSKAPVKGMRMYVNRANGLLEYQNCDRDDGSVDIKAISYFRPRALPAGLFEPNDTRVRTFEFLDRKIVRQYENLEIYEETMLKHGANAP